MSTTKSWQESLTFLHPQAVPATIGGQSINFYPVSVGKLFELRSVAGPLAKALMTLMSENTTDVGYNKVQTEEQTDEAYMPPSVDIINLRHSQQNDAVTELVDALSSLDNMTIVGGIIMDSMHDQFPPGDTNNPPALEFISSTPVTILPQYLKGVLKANEGILGDFLGNAGSLLSNAVEKVKAKARNTPSKQEPTTG